MNRIMHAEGTQNELVLEVCIGYKIQGDIRLKFIFFKQHPSESNGTDPSDIRLLKSDSFRFDLLLLTQSDTYNPIESGPKIEVHRYSSKAKKLII